MNGLLSSTGLATVQSGLSRAKSALDRALLWPVCLHPEIMRECPPGDLANARKTGIALYLTAIYMWLAFTNASRVMLSPSGELRLSDVLMGFLVAAVVTMIDVNVFVQGSYFSLGITEAERTGQFKLPHTRSARSKGALLLAIRIAMAVTTANFIATTATTEAFNKEIQVQITREHTRQNAPIIKAAGERIQAEILASERQQESLRALIVELDGEARRFRALVVEPGVSDPDHRAAVEALATAQVGKAEAETALLDARTLSADELSGTCRASRRGQPSRSCRQGRGPKWIAAQERIRAAEARLAAADAAVRGAETRLNASESGYAGEKQRKIEVGRTRVAEITGLREESERRLAKLVADHRAQFSDRDRLVQETVRNDPNFVPREDGLLARVKALRELMNEPAVAAMTYLVDLLLVLIELAAVLSVMVSFVPMTYATKLVERDLKRAYETARRLAGLAGGAVAPEPPHPGAQPTAPSIVPPAPATGPGSPPPATPASPSRNPRHPPRWTPASSSAGAGQAQGENSPSAGTNGNGKAPPSSSAT